MKKNDQERYRDSSDNFYSKHKKYLNRRGKIYQRFKSPLTDTIGSSKIIHAPKKISIYSFDVSGINSFNDTIEFKKQLEKYLPKSNCIIDFSQTERITVAAMLIIYSQIQKSTTQSDFKVSVGWSRTDKGVNQTIKKSGLKKLIENKATTTKFSSKAILPVITGVGNQHYDEIVDFILHRFYGKKVTPDAEYLIADAISETMNNVGLHAYPNSELSSKEWWLKCDIIGDQLYLAIYDTGVGIPKTVVEKKWFYSSLKVTYPKLYNECQHALGTQTNMFEFFTVNKYKDAELIYMSMQGDVTGTKKSKHGQGSKSIKALVNETKGGKLWVYSNKGLYKVEPGDTAPQVYKLPSKLNGTLIQWNIKIQ